MNLKWETATKRQLLQIVLNEDCDFSYKYTALRELQLNRWTDDMLTDLVVLWGKGLSAPSIAKEIGIGQDKINEKLQQYGLYKRRVSA